MLSWSMGTFSDKELGLSREHMWLLLPNFQTGIKKQITAAGWKLCKDELIEEIHLLAVSHRICPECFPETGSFWRAMDPLGLRGLVSCQGGLKP